MGEGLPKLFSPIESVGLGRQGREGTVEKDEDRAKCLWPGPVRGVPFGKALTQSVNVRKGWMGSLFGPYRQPVYTFPKLLRNGFEYLVGKPSEGVEVQVYPPPSGSLPNDF